MACLGPGPLRWAQRKAPSAPPPPNRALSTRPTHNPLRDNGAPGVRERVGPCPPPPPRTPTGTAAVKRSRPRRDLHRRSSRRTLAPQRNTNGLTQAAGPGRAVSSPAGPVTGPPGSPRPVESRGSGSAEPTQTQTSGPPEGLAHGGWVHIQTGCPPCVTCGAIRRCRCGTFSPPHPPPSPEMPANAAPWTLKQAKCPDQVPAHVLEPLGYRGRENFARGQFRWG